MAVAEFMTWAPKQRRWLKKYKGKMYSVSPRQLGTEATKEASRKAANDWWVDKQAEIDAKLNTQKHPVKVTRHYEEAMSRHHIFARWHRKYGDMELAERAETMIEWLREALKTEQPTFPLTKWQYDPAYEEKLDETQYWVWRDRERQIRREERRHNVPVENTIRAHVDEYLKTRKAKCLSGKNKLGSYQTFMHRLNHFRRFTDPNAPVESITETLWEQFYIYLATKVSVGEMSQSTMSSVLVAAREFIRSRWERRLIELPRNLNSRSLSMSAPLQEIVTFTKEEVRQLLDGASERMRLYLLLMLNCGMYSVDIGSLRQDEVDWQEGRIVRQRTKTRGMSEKVPKVNYLLWRETFGLLKRHRADNPDLALLNEQGRPLWSEYEKPDGKYTRSDAIKNLFFRLKRKLEIPKGKGKSIKTIRKTASSMLEEHETYGQYAEYFLGEAPSSTASRHYVKPSNQRFDKAIVWLGKQFDLD